MFARCSQAEQGSSISRLEPSVGLGCVYNHSLAFRMRKTQPGCQVVVVLGLVKIPQLLVGAAHVQVQRRIKVTDAFGCGQDGSFQPGRLNQFGLLCRMDNSMPLH
jgi:hypothetical protein